jgi:hypothetical protein
VDWEVHEAPKRIENTAVFWLVNRKMEIWHDLVYFGIVLSKNGVKMVYAE